MIGLKHVNILTLLVAVALMACGGAKSKSREAKTDADAEPQRAELYDYSVVKEYPHATESYTQGLEYKMA